MGSVQSTQDSDSDHEPEPEPRERLLKQEPEVRPCQSPATPLSPLAGTPRLRVWDPSNLLTRGSGSSDSIEILDRTVEIYLICHGECGLVYRPDLIGGRSTGAALTGAGERQGRALAVFLRSQGVRFDAVFCSPLDRALATAVAVCQELGISKHEIHTSDSLTDMSQGQWEGCHKSDVYTPHMINLIEQTRADFCAPSGESLRQVEFRMVDFIHRTVLGDLFPPHYHHHYHNQADMRDMSGASISSLRQSFGRKRSGKSRLHVMAMGENEAEDELSNGDVRINLTHLVIAVFSHATPIRCLLAGILGSGPSICNRICIDDSSVSVMGHSLRTGWRVKKINDTAHLRLL